MTISQQRRIQRLQKQVAQQITSQQIIPTLHQCIKQLIDNAIDAKATIIKIQLQQYGKVTFSVYDNGTGIKQVEKLGEGGNTSKLLANNQNYLEDIRTLGFRGQAVNSIANLCKQMTIQTVYKSQQSQLQEKQKFTEVNYSVTQRTILDKKSSSLLKNTFTKITVQNLFYNIPVRKYQLQNKPKENLKKVYELLFQISLIFPQITFILINTVDGKEELLFQAQRHFNKSSKKQHTIFENYFYKDISKESWKQRIQICFPQKLDDCLAFIKSKNVEGFILNTIESGSSKKNLKFPKNLQYTFINRRPVNPLKQICKIFDSYYKKYNPYTKYVFFLNIKVEPSEIDVNLSPNKRDIFIKKDRLEDILRQLKQLIEKQVIEKITDLGEYKQAKLKKIQSRSEKKNSVKRQQQQSDNQDEAQQKTNSFIKKQKQQQNKKSSTQSELEDSFRIRQQVFTSKVSANRQQKALKGNYLANYQRVNTQLNSNMLEELNRRSMKGNVKVQSKIGLSQSMVKGQKIDKVQEKEEIQREINSQSQQQEGIQQLQQEQNGQQQDKVQLNIAPLKITQEMKNKIFQLIKKSFQTKKENAQVVDIKSKSNSKNDNNKIKIENYQFQNQNQDEKVKVNIKETSLHQGYKRESHQDFINMTQRDQQKIDQNLHKKQEPNCYPHHQGTNSNSNHHHRQQRQQPNSDIKIENFQIPDNINYVTEQNRGEITKKDFKHFHIHGQFNKGFILCSLEQKQYLYIIDQHASEQKRLFQSYMDSKPTFYYLSKEIQLTPIQVDQIQMARQELIQSGFTFTIQGRTTLKILRCPSHFKKNFGLQQFMQIAQTNKNIKDIPSFYNSAASKACRTAVMIGDELGKNRMIDIVHKMSDLKSPWNCPHGRPSLISLGSFQSIIRKIKPQKQKYKF